MSDRLKRRKKGGGKAPQQGANTNAVEPLQPKYFENEIGETSVPDRRKQPAPMPERETQADFHLESRAEVQPAAAPSLPEVTARSGRRRRRRGGREPRRLPAVTPAGAARPLPGVESVAQEPESAGVSEARPQAEPISQAVAVESPAAATGHVSMAAPVQAPSSAPPPPASAPARSSKGTVILAIGLPGSGKSSWFKRHNVRPLSSDLLRELLFDDAEEQRFQDLVFSNLRSMLKARLIARRPMNYVDATNLTPHDRHSWIKLAKDYGYDVQGLFFDVPLEICMERHQRRGRLVPEDIMRRMAAKLKPPTFEEGFSKITVVRVKKKEEAAS